MNVIVDRLTRGEKYLKTTDTMEALGDLSGYLAYQFNNILQIIRGNIELILLTTDEDDKNYKRLEAIYAAVEEGNYLTRRLFSLKNEEQKFPEEKTDDSGSYIRRGKETILIIDNNREIREITGEMLKQFSYKTIPVDNASDAFKIMEKHNKEIDLILVDFAMPDENGIDFTKKIKEKYPKAKVVLMSGYSLNDSFREIFDAGATSYLHKPFTTKELLKTVRKSLNGGVDKKKE